MSDQPKSTLRCEHELTDGGPVEPPRPIASRRRIKCSILLVALVAGGWFAHFAYLRITLRPEPRTAHWRAKLATIDPAPPAAISAAEAYDLLIKRSFETPIPPNMGFAGEWQYLLEESLRQVWNTEAEHVRAATKVLESNAFQSARLAMQRAVRPGWKDAAHLTYGDLPGELGRAYEVWALWLLAHSRWALTQGKNGDAVEDWVTILRLSRQPERHRTIIGLAAASELRRQLGSVMLLREDDTVALADTCSLMHQMDEILGPVPCAADIVAGERWQRYSRLDAIYVRRGSGWMDLSAAVEQSRGAAPARFWNVASGLFSSYRTASEHIERLFTELAECRNVLACERLKSDQEKTNDFLDCPVLIEWQYPGLSEVAQRYYYSRTRLEAGLASLAVQEYWRVHGKFPAKLPDLVPELLPRVPVDYVDGNPLRYLSTLNGYVLYSVGPNGIDDGGSELEDAKGNTTDLVFSVHKLRKPDE